MIVHQFIVKCNTKERGKQKQQPAYLRWPKEGLTQCQQFISHIFFLAAITRVRRDVSGLSVELFLGGEKVGRDVGGSSVELFAGYKRVGRNVGGSSVEHFSCPFGGRAVEILSTGIKYYRDFRSFDF